LTVGGTEEVMHRRRSHNPVETLESRRLLSASAALDAITAQPLLTLSPQATNSSFAGLPPAQVKKAYGIDAVSFNGIRGDGSGQTIAIVGAFDAPTIAGDLKAFDKQFSLADAPSFKKVSQTGSTTSLPAADADWALELSLDVEWAHAVAPKANILLVEAKSDSLGNLLSAVDYARSAVGVSVVSISWGADEFWGETSYDFHFTTPAGHQGVTFVAASGDDGSRFGPMWPSVASSVLSVGGTALSVSSTGTYGSERGWSGSGGGESWYENEPSYQSNVQSTGARTSPDVSYNADPNAGFAVYDTTTLEGHRGWWIVGGTSAGTPQWAGLVAIADQGRKLAGKSSLNGATQTLPTLYSLGNSATTYSADFHDIASGRTSRFVSAGDGYDLVSGLGSPQANGVVLAL
jgi:subtilase family serine protease